MDYTPVIIDIIGVLFATAAVFASIGYFLKGKNQGKFDTIKLFKEQVGALETKVNDQETEITKLTNEVKDLHRAIDEREKKLADMMQILQGRDPEMIEFIKRMKLYTDTATPIMKDIKEVVMPAIKNLNDFLDVQKKFK